MGAGFTGDHFLVQDGRTERGHIADANTLAHWKMDEAEFGTRGTLTDEIGNNTISTCVGTQTTLRYAGGPWIGMLDDVILYTYARTAAQILEDYSRGRVL